MPERATDTEFHERAARSGYAINVLPQTARHSVNGGEIVETDGTCWQWNVRARSANIATGHSCGTPQIAFDRALAKLRELVADEGSTEPRRSSGGVVHPGVGVSVHERLLDWAAAPTYTFTAIRG